VLVEQAQVPQLASPRPGYGRPGARRICAGRRALPLARQGQDLAGLPAHPRQRVESARPPARGFNKIPTTLQRSSPNLVVTIQPQLAERTEHEITMHPTIMSHVAKHRIADWHRQADRDRIARAARAAAGSTPAT
jgi:hypothetical protein